MEKKQLYQLTEEIDKLTNSIENVITGEVFDTQITKLSSIDSRQIINKDWQFDWKRELKEQQREVYKLTTINNPKIIQGLIEIEDKGDHIFLLLVESAKFNKGKNKVYFGVPANLTAFACKTSFEKGYDGYVAFDSKSALIEHYKKTLGATHFRGIRMYIDTPNAFRLTKQYFKDFKYETH